MSLRPAEAVEWVRRNRLVTVVPVGDLPSVVAAVVGGPVRGSWWGHPAGKRIYACLVALSESNEVVGARLAAGKVTLVHRALWPALYRIVTDRAWRRRSARGLGTLARRLLGAVIRAGEVRVDLLSRRWGVSLTGPKNEIAARLLVQKDEVHTERGSHSTILRDWRVWAPGDVARAAAALGFAEALEALKAASGGTPLAVETAARRSARGRRARGARRPRSRGRRAGRDSSNDLGPVQAARRRNASSRRA